MMYLQNWALNLRVCNRSQKVLGIGGIPPTRRRTGWVASVLRAAPANLSRAVLAVAAMSFGLLPAHSRNRRTSLLRTAR